MDMIRCSAKALLLSPDGRLLLNRCETSSGEEYFDLPGGGQHVYETMEEAVAREVLEETGLVVEPVRFAALCEEIFTDPDMRRRFPQYCHRTLHIFLARTVSKNGAREERNGLPADRLSMGHAGGGGNFTPCAHSASGARAGGFELGGAGVPGLCAPGRGVYVILA